MAQLPYLLSILNISVGIWLFLQNSARLYPAYVTIIFTLIPVLDFFTLRIAKTESPQGENFIHKLIIHIYPILHFVFLIQVLHFLKFTQIDFSFYELTLFVGLASGASGFTFLHELIHRKERYLRILGETLSLIGFMQFYSRDHIRIHHALVGTAQDPASARLNQSVYHYLYENF